MLLYYVDTLLRYVDMLFYYVDIYFRNVKASLCYVVTSFLFVMCKPHIIILKANMNSYVLLQMAAIFFSVEPLSKTGY